VFSPASVGRLPPFPLGNLLRLALVQLSSSKTRLVVAGGRADGDGVCAVQGCGHAKRVQPKAGGVGRSVDPKGGPLGPVRSGLAAGEAIANPAGLSIAPAARRPPGRSVVAPFPEICCALFLIQSSWEYLGEPGAAPKGSIQLCF